MLKRFLLFTQEYYLGNPLIDWIFQILRIDKTVLIGHTAMLFFSLFVSVSFTLGSIIANKIDPLVITTARFILAASLIWFVFSLNKITSFWDLKSPLRFLTLGGLISCYFVTMFEGLKTADPIAMSAIFTLTPIIAGVSDFIISGRKLSFSVWVAVLLGGLGALLIIFEGKMENLLNFQIGYGEAVFFLGCTCHAIYAALISKLNRGESAVSQTLGTLLAASLILSLISVEKIIQTDWMSLPAIVWFSLIYLAVFATAASFFLLQFSARRLSSLKVMAYTYAVPFWVTSLEFSLFRVEISTHLIAGGSAIFVSLLFLLLNREF